VDGGVEERQVEERQVGIERQRNFDGRELNIF
jgi:hypothetical protein